MSTAEIIQFTHACTHLIACAHTPWLLPFAAVKQLLLGGCGRSYVWPTGWGVWNKPGTGINGEAMLCDRGYKVADKHWGAAYWAALKPVQNRREEICLTCRVPFWCCQLKRVRNITTAAAREVSEQESDASAPLAVTSTWRVHFNEGLWWCQRFCVYFNLCFNSFLAGRCRKQLQREMFYIYTECIPVVNRQHNCLSGDCNREDLYGCKYAFLGSAHRFYVNLIVSAKLSCLMKKLKYYQRHSAQVNILARGNSHINHVIIAQTIQRTKSKEAI